jgi:hypothetical protein
MPIWKSGPLLAVAVLIVAETVTQLQIHVELQSLGLQKLFYAFHQVIINYIQLLDTMYLVI